MIDWLLHTTAPSPPYSTQRRTTMDELRERIRKEITLARWGREPHDDIVDRILALLPREPHKNWCPSCACQECYEMSEDDDEDG